jgi:hypothetical protein
MSERTASSADGWMNCGMWTKDSGPKGPAAFFGDDIHKIVECTLADDPLGLPKMTPRHYRVSTLALEWLNDKKNIQVVPTPEPAYAIAPSGEVRLLGTRIARKYKEHGATDEDICGSADVVSDGVCIDLKTGREASWEKHEAQMRILGYCVAKKQNVDRVRCVVLHVTEKGAVPYERELDALDLGAIGHELKTARELPKEPRVGPWCEKSYCGSRATCPAYLRMRGAA